MENTTKSTSTDQFNLKIYFGIILITFVLIAFAGGYVLGKGSNMNPADLSKNEPNTSSKQISENTSPTPIAATLLDAEANKAATQDENACTKYGFAQKWEYLTPYIIKENESLPIIAKEQLKDETRLNEITKINGFGPFVVGSTLYLPPSSITKSSGNLKQVYGKLYEKDSTSWHLILSTDPKGQGILIPTYLFEKVPNKDSYKVGDCLKVFLDDGFEIYSVSLQS